MLDCDLCRSAPAPSPVFGDAAHSSMEGIRMGWAGALRRELSARNQQIALMTGVLHELTAAEMPSVIFGCKGSRHGNFYPASFRTFARIRNGRGGLPRSIPDRGERRPLQGGDGGNWTARTAQTHCS